VFDPFHRASNVIGKIGGTGIGLTSSKQIVEQHGGTIAAANGEHGGTRFTVRLPILDPADDAPESAEM
jgi:two-component system OmpR family sensor kinase